MSSIVDSDVSHFRLRVLLMELARIGSETPRTMEEPLLGFDKFNSRSALRSSLTVPVGAEIDQSTSQCEAKTLSTHPPIHHLRSPARARRF